MNACTISVLGLLLAAMANDEPPYLSVDNMTAMRAVRQLEDAKNASALADVVERGRNQAVKLRAIKAMGEVADQSSVKRMLAILDGLNTDVVEGGLEQKIENTQLKTALTSAIAQRLKLRLPNWEAVEAIRAFFESAHRAQIPK
jgi:hypothetical protein